MKSLLMVSAVNAFAVSVLAAAIILLAHLSPWLILLVWLTAFSVSLSMLGIVAGGARGEV